MEGGDRHRCLLVADFEPGNLAGLLGNDGEEPQVEVIAAPCGQVVPVLLDGEGAWWREEPDCCLVWTRPEVVCPPFARLLEGERVEVEELLAEVDAHAGLLRAAAERVRALFAPAWWVPTCNRGYGLLDLRPGIGVGDALLRMNLRLADALADAGDVFLMDVRKWVEAAGDAAFNPKLWHMAKIPFGNGVFAAAVRDLKAGLAGLDGRARKLVVVDLDDTLWGGVVGEVGIEGLRLGGHDHVGEAHVAFQRALKGLTRRGILLAIASRNDEELALEAIDRHPEMVLRREDFAGWRIDWNDKAQNIADLVEELNLGLESVVFIDDSPAERGRVREALPEVLVPEWPADPAFYAAALQGLRCFDVPQLGEEDRRRAGMYAAERERRAARRRVASLEEWLASLELKVDVGRLGEENGARAAQLLNRTNQMNLTTRRLSREELLEWVAGEGREVWVFRVRDRFGDSGLTGLIGLEREGEQVRLTDYVLSCRVMGRQVEETLIHHAVQRVREMGGERLIAGYLPTPRNRPCRDFCARVMVEEEANRFAWSVDDPFPLPAHVELSR